MRIALVLTILLATALGGCAVSIQTGVAPEASACEQQGEASYACQVERYRNANE